MSINRIKVEIKELGEDSTGNKTLSPYLIPEYFVLSTDPISNQISITFQYINEESGVSETLDNKIIVGVGKTSKKIIFIKNGESLDLKSLESHIKNKSYSNKELIIKILKKYLPKKSKS